MKNLARISIFVAALLLPSVAGAVSVIGGVGSGGWFFGIGSGGGFGIGCAGDTICLLASKLLYMIDYVLVPLVFAIAFIVFLYGVATKYIFSHGNEAKVEEGHRLILWGIVGFVVMISVWGIVNVVVNTLGLAGIPPPPLPPAS